jgi:hypothetical protein
MAIDLAFVAKLVICEQWDRALGLHETHPFSAVFALKTCYAIRRPFFVAVDIAFA